jgi:hypothetical protein
MPSFLSDYGALFRHGQGPFGSYISSTARLWAASVDDELRLDARGSIRLELGGASLDVEPSCPNTHGASIGGPVSEVDLALSLEELALRAPCGTS